MKTKNLQAPSSNNFALNRDSSLRENIPFEKLFNPRAIAVIGAGKESFGGGGFFIRILKTLAYEGPIYPINPKYVGEQTYEYDFYGSILDVPNDPPVDFAIIAVPARVTPMIIEEVGKKNIPFVHIFSSGYSEVGENGATLEQELIKNARNGNVRIIGPNCLGIFNPRSKVSFSDYAPLEPGSVGFISQSGGLGARLIRHGKDTGIKFSKVVSLGNQIDLDVLDFLKYFKNDPETKIIAMYIENLKRDGHAFVQLLKETTIEKPVIIWKGGFSETGNSAVMSHTGGLAGKYEMWQAMAKQTGVLLVENFEQLSYLIRGFLTYKIPKTLGTAPISGGGGLAIEATDASERVRIPTSNRIGIEIPQLTENARDKLSEFVLGVNTSVKNPLDFGAQGFDLDVVVKAVNILGEEMKEISTIMFINSPEVLIRYAYRFAKTKEDQEKLDKLKPIELLKTSIDKWIESMKYDQLLMSITAEQYSTKEALTNRYDYVSLLREKRIMSFNTVAESAQVLLQMWTYGQYLQKHGKQIF